MIDRYGEHSALLLKQLPKGIFITVKAQGEVNTMTIAWGHIGVIWGKPMFIAYVRYSRYTYDLLVRAKDYTINVPAFNTMKEALKIAGTESGRDSDKFEKAGLVVKDSRKVESPILADCQLQYECKMVYKQTQEPALIPEDIKMRYYPQHDTHIMFFGEIVETYLTED